MTMKKKMNTATQHDITISKRLGELQRAEDYVSKIGAREPHMPDSIGKLATLTVDTTIEHQAAPGAKSFWHEPTFDLALAEVIKAEFPRLAALAVARMADAYTDACIAAKDAIREQLEQIERMEAERASAQPRDAEITA
jgi:hypothetical protein